MIKVAILAVNDGCEKNEKWLMDFLEIKFSQQKEFKLIDFKGLNISEMLEKNQAEADYTCLVYDAKRGMNYNFKFVAEQLYSEGIKPILIITNVDSQNINLVEADNAMAFVWSSIEPRLERSQLYFHNLYFSYSRQAFSLSPQINKVDDISDLFKRLG